MEEETGLEDVRKAIKKAVDDKYPNFEVGKYDLVIKKKWLSDLIII